MFTRTLTERLADGGRPGKGKQMFAIYRALIAAGTDVDVAYTETCLIYDVASGYNWKVDAGASALRSAMRVVHSKQYPEGQWARVLRHHGLAGLYLSDDHDDVRNWTKIPGPRVAIPEDFAEVQS